MLLEQKRQEALAAEQKLNEQQKSLPNVTSQQALRGQKFGGGLQGRDLRRQVLGVGEQIAQKQAEVAQYKQGLQQYEQGLQQTEAQIRQAQEYNEAVESVNIAARKGYLGALKYYGTDLQKQLASDLEYEQAASNAAYEKEINKFKDQGLNPIVQNGRIVGFEDANLQQTYALDKQIPIPENLIPKYEKAGFTFEQTPQTPSVPQYNIQDIINSRNVANLPRTDKKQFSQGMLPLVSAQTLNSQSVADNYGGLGVSNRLSTRGDSGLSGPISSQLRTTNNNGGLISGFIAGYKKTFQAPQTQSVLSNPINPATGRPFGIVSAAPTTLQQYGTQTKQKGYVEGTLSFIGNKPISAIERLNTILARKGYQGTYKGEAAIGELSRESPKILYFTPVGPPLMIAGGAEKLLRGKTRTERAVGAGEAILGASAYAWPKIKAELKTPYNVEVIGEPQTGFAAKGLTSAEQTYGQAIRVTKTPYLTYEIPAKTKVWARLTTGKVSVPKSAFKDLTRTDISIQPFLIRGEKAGSFSATRKFGKRTSLTTFQQTAEIQKPLQVNDFSKLPKEARYMARKLPPVVQEGTETFYGVSENYKGFGRDVGPKVSVGKDIIADFPKRINRFSKKQLELFFPTERLNPEYIKSISRVRQFGSIGNSKDILFPAFRKPSITKISAKEMVKNGEIISAEDLPLGEYWGSTHRAYVRKDVPKSVLNKVILHEQGHAYSRAFKVEKGLTNAEKDLLFGKAEIHLTKKYGEKIPYPKEKYISEYLADTYKGQVPIGKIKIKTNEPSIDVFGVKSVSKQTKGVRGIARGKVDKDVGIVLLQESKMPLEVNYVGKSAKQLTKKQQSQLVAQIKDILPIPKQSARKPPSSKTTKTILEDLGILPKAVGGIGSLKSQYAGTGQYELTTEEVPLIPSVSAKSVQSSDLFLTRQTKSNVQNTVPKQNDYLKDFIGLAQPSVSRQREGLLQLPGQMQLNKNAQPTRSRESLVPKQAQPSKLGLLQKQGLLQRLLSMPKTKGRTPTRRPPNPPKRPPRLPPFLPPLSFSGSERKKRSYGEEVFDIFIRKKGQDILFGKAKTERQAAEKLFGGLKNSLAASGYVQTGTGRKVDLSNFLFGQEFRRSKRDNLRFVQEKGFRLGTQSERSSIQAARRNAPRRRKNRRMNWFR